MSNLSPNRVTAAAPVRAITFTTPDPDQPADAATDPHAAPAAPAPSPEAPEPDDKPARKGK